MFPQKACLWACSHICHLSISETTIAMHCVSRLCISRFQVFANFCHTSRMLSAIYHVNLQITLKWEKCSKNPPYQIICALQDSRFFTTICHTSRMLSVLQISCESSDYSLSRNKSIPQIHHFKTKKILKRSRLNGLNWGWDKLILQIRWGCCNW